MGAVTVYVTDWSNHDNGALTQAQADGLVGFWHKTTDGDHWYADPFFKPHCDMARSLGVDSLGGYHVVWGDRDLTSQARWFVDRVRAQAPDARVFMSDNEPFGYNVAPTIDQVNAFNLAVVDYALIPSSSALAYCPQWHYGSAISGLRYPWVQSNYGPNSTGPYKTVYEQTVGDSSSRWSGPAAMPFLQYGSRTDVGDANAFRGSAADFFAFLSSAPLQPGGDMIQVLVRYSDAPDRPDGSPGYLQVYLADGMRQRPLPDSFFVLPPGGLLSPVPGIVGNDGTHASNMLGNLGNGGQIFLVGAGGWANRAAWGLMDGDVPPPSSGAPASYTISLSGSMSGSARPVPPATGQ